MSNYKQYFENINFRKKILEKKQKEIDKLLSTKFSFFDYYYFGENNISDIFRDLLDIEGNHGQQDLFLNLFLKILFKDDLEELQNLKLKTINIKPIVKREVRTDRIDNNKRRIDIIIEWSNEYVIAIENKPFEQTPLPNSNIRIVEDDDLV